MGMAANFFDLPGELRDLVYAELWDHDTRYFINLAGHTFAVHAFLDGPSIRKVVLGDALPRSVIADQQLSWEVIGQLQRSASWSSQG